MKLWCILVLTLVLYIAGILLFTKGFLLKRITVTLNSTCVPPVSDDRPLPDSSCWVQHYFRKSVFIIIDALRFDFVTYDHTSQSQLPYYRNKLTCLFETARDYPNNARLYRFIADPPTTTLQRLKGLTTGSLPTFVDAGTNFASTEICEDNIINQFVSRGNNITFMGDDTWQALFPRQFTRSYAFPSFNVKDIHTVDKGVSSHLLTELRRSDWQILIAHYLGVDHCGHTYGPNHPVMADKLRQMDSELRSVMNEMDEDTVLFVLGDHGMTSTGDHGGDSMAELEAALFVFSKRPITYSPSKLDRNMYDTVSQVDLVPTISMLLGSPIPFSNLGFVIPELFNVSYVKSSNQNSDQFDAAYHQLKVFQLNAHQVHKYIMSYIELSDELPHLELNNLNSLLLSTDNELVQLLALFPGDSVHHSLDTIENFKKLQSQYGKYVVGIRTLCQSVWSKFDLVSMLMGGMLVLLGIFVNILCVCIAQSISFKIIGGLVVYVIAVCISIPMLYLLIELSIIEWCCVVCCIVAVHAVATVVFCKQHISLTLMTSVDLFSLLLCLLRSATVLSNSFIVYENRLLLYFVISLLLAQVFCILFKASTIANEMRQSSHFSRSLRQLFSCVDVNMVLAVASVAMVSLRLSTYFHACREEQTDCELSLFAQPLSVYTSDVRQLKMLRYVLSIGSLIALYSLVIKWLRYWGNLNGDSLVVVMMSYIVPLAVGIVCLYWLLDGMLVAELKLLITVVINILPRLVYMLSLSTLLVLFISPLCMYLLRPSPENIVVPQLQQTSADAIVPQIYSHLHSNWKTLLTTQKTQSRLSQRTPNANISDSASATPVVYGLATVYSSAQIVMLFAVTLVIVLLLGDNMSPSVALYFAAVFCLLELHAYNTHLSLRKPDGKTSAFDVSWVTIVQMLLISWHGFYITGHQPTIAGIQWHAAFHGFGQHGHSTVWMPALLVAVNTFSSHILTVLSLPLLIYWPFTRGRPDGVVSGEAESKGEFALNEDDGRRLKLNCFRLLMKFLLLSAVQVLATMFCAAIHRRHLMVWKIFAPNFVYTTASFIVVSITLLVVYLFVYRVNKALTKWVTALCS